jgi:hypothetical protein
MAGLIRRLRQLFGLGARRRGPRRAVGHIPVSPVAPKTHSSDSSQSRAPDLNAKQA